jgi:2-keto-4-pentenoate hydratase/2-oxohepta-3-ene-1,7-dioic acid hydratase in catechol pathway
VLLTGTGISVSADAALAPGDVVSIRADGIGELSNPVSAV